MNFDPPPVAPRPAKPALSPLERLPPGTEWVAIAAGGAIGAMLRFAIALGLETGAAHPALATFVVNLSGAFALGLLVERIERHATQHLLRPFFVIGLLGSFTTFSALVLDAHGLALERGGFGALLHLVLSIGFGLAAFAVGTRAASLLGDGDRGASRRATELER